ncbi:LacI family DNA-binding transcriptional regulator [Tichowtungia aerotolerans]|uniref:LacI family DNA-binding transcriptional regulator n=1 Tax=Tichowtungia aerotolerans TaxID=2697043 RepID=A0A6P1M6B0_9BACT|nr:LacI family DNA-binding transcriptional regulator [Tichowtungia aerotolerans]QHI69397.1 LacI family DNA-binding transcriptional regulator [Tichowtungia aerotolerans]
MNLNAVAERAGVSVATVSRVINNREGVSRAKAEEIRQIINELGFVPKPRAARISSPQFPEGVRYGNIAVLVLGQGYVGAAELFVRQLGPICRGLSRFGIAPIVCLDVQTPKEMPVILQKKQIDGILIFGDMNDMLRDYFDGIPVFWMTSHHEGSDTLILTGNREVGHLGARYCHEKGCRKVVAIGAHQGPEVWTSRCEAFAEMAKGFSMESSLLLGGVLPDMEASIDQVVVENADLFQAADGIFFQADRLAAYAYPALHRVGVFDAGKKPVVISCGGERSYLSGLSPRPVSIDIGADLLGKQAVEQILWRIRYPEETRHFSVVIQPEIVDPF